MRYDSNLRRIYVRQSWLNDLLICPERSRLSMIHPERRMPSTETLMGTACHAAIEAKLRDPEGVSEFTMFDIADAEYERLRKEPHKDSGISDVPDLLHSMLFAFKDEILPEVELGGMIEHKFNVPLNVILDGWSLHLEGTVDYISPSGVVWDWKTSGRAYSQLDKQKHAVQPTVYGHALGMLGLVPNPDEVEFRYGVMVRQMKPKGSVVPIMRNKEHFAWLRYQIQSAVYTASRVGTVVPWLMNDQGNLCNPKWCDHWSVCKGAYVTEASFVGGN